MNKELTIDEMEYECSRNNFTLTDFQGFYHLNQQPLINFFYYLHGDKNIFLPPSFLSSKKIIIIFSLLYLKINKKRLFFFFSKSL